MGAEAHLPIGQFMFTRGRHFSAWLAPLAIGLLCVACATPLDLLAQGQASRAISLVYENPNPKDLEALALSIAAQLDPRLQMEEIDPLQLEKEIHAFVPRDFYADLTILRGHIAHQKINAKVLLRWSLEIDGKSAPSAKVTFANLAGLTEEYPLKPSGPKAYPTARQKARYAPQAFALHEASWVKPCVRRETKCGFSTLVPRIRGDEKINLVVSARLQGDFADKTTSPELVLEYRIPLEGPGGLGKRLEALFDQGELQVSSLAQAEITWHPPRARFSPDGRRRFQATADKSTAAIEIWQRVQQKQKIEPPVYPWDTPLGLSTKPPKDPPSIFAMKKSKTSIPRVQAAAKLFAQASWSGEENLSGALLVCRLEDRLRRPDPGGPDLWLKLDLGKGQKVTVGAKGDAYVSYVSVPAMTLHRGQRIRAKIWDADVFSSDSLGRLAGRYQGTLPIILQSRKLRMECRGYSRQSVEKMVVKPMAKLDRLLSALPRAVFEHHQAVLPSSKTFRRVSALLGPNDPRVRQRRQWIIDYLAKKKERAREIHLALADSLPNPAQRIEFDNKMALRLLEISCDAKRRADLGEWLADDRCFIRLEMILPKTGSDLGPIRVHGKIYSLDGAPVPIKLRARDRGDGFSMKRQAGCGTSEILLGTGANTLGQAPHLAQLWLSKKRVWLRLASQESGP